MQSAHCNVVGEKHYGIIGKWAPWIFGFLDFISLAAALPVLFLKVLCCVELHFPFSDYHRLCLCGSLVSLFSVILCFSVESLLSFLFFNLYVHHFHSVEAGNLWLHHHIIKSVCLLGSHREGLLGQLLFQHVLQSRSPSSATMKMLKRAAADAYLWGSGDSKSMNESAEWTFSMAEPFLVFYLLNVSGCDSAWWASGNDDWRSKADGWAHISAESFLWLQLQSS